MTDLERDGAMSDLILQAARAAIPADVDSLITVPDSGPRNRPLMPLLLGLIDATHATARAVADNARDSAHPLDRKMVNVLDQQLRSIARELESVADLVMDGDWSLPSMTGKELV